MSKFEEFILFANFKFHIKIKQTLSSLNLSARIKATQKDDFSFEVFFVEV